VLLHASVLKKDFEKGVGYRLTNSTMFPMDSMFKTLMVSQRDYYFFELDFEMCWIVRVMCEYLML
jgi:hypothetical protein